MSDTYIAPTLLGVSRRFGNTYVHAMGYWHTPSDPGFIDVYALCSRTRIRGHCILIRDQDPHEYVARQFQWDPRDGYHNHWPVCPGCLAAYTRQFTPKIPDVDTGADGNNNQAKDKHKP